MALFEILGDIIFYFINSIFNILGLFSRLIDIPDSIISAIHTAFVFIGTLGFFLPLTVVSACVAIVFAVEIFRINLQAYYFIRQHIPILRK